jgi:hypothetical protein
LGAAIEAYGKLVRDACQPTASEWVARRQEGAPIDQNTPVPLSIIIATHSPWPQVEECLASVVDQAHAAGAEIILADGCGRALPEVCPRPYGDIIWLRALGASTFRLRSLALAHARGAIVAVTEDHCHVDAEWCAAILRAHAEHPSAAAVGGAVENGASRHLVDWADFLIANGAFMRPLRHGATERIALQANISYKRHAVPAESFTDLGLMEMLHNQTLLRQGATLIADDRIVVDHVQCLGFPTFCALHFHNGRSIAGFRLTRIGTLERVLRLGGCLVLPPVMLWRTLSPVLEKRRFVGRALASLPLLMCLLLCHATGEFLGYLAGPGDSPRYRHIG